MGEGPCIHVLVVDDCPIDRKIVQKLLLKTGTFTCNFAVFLIFLFWGGKVVVGTFVAFYDTLV